MAGGVDAAARAAAPFLFVGGHLALDFVNTRPVEGGKEAERFAGFGDVLAWLRTAGTLEGDEAAAAERWEDTPDGERVFAEALALRGAMRDAAAHLAEGTPVPATAVAAINRVLEGRPGHLELAASEGGFVRRFRGRRDAAIHLLAPVAEAAADLLAGASAVLVKRCANPACVLYFADATKNRTRRWCSMSGCGNRTKVAAYHRRRRAAAAPPSADPT
ncbi:MAG: ABATE domain-containing protein [Chloroflexia bacterium]|nr:ABATE domain-containing protein [Chloroflexia bacterium]